MIFIIINTKLEYKFQNSNLNLNAIITVLEGGMLSNKSSFVFFSLLGYVI